MTAFQGAGIQRRSPDEIGVAGAQSRDLLKSASVAVFCARPALARFHSSLSPATLTCARNSSFLLYGLGVIDHFPGQTAIIEFQHDVDELRGLVMRCLLAHKWVVGQAFNVRSRIPYVRSILPYRICERCGTMQRGTYDAYSRDVDWETMRERTYIKSEQIRIVRRPSSRLEQLAHTLGLRRSRIGDGTRSERRSVPTRS